MSHKKRFEQIESKTPEEVKKPSSLLERFHFQRKLELPGVPRERDPAKPVSTAADEEKTDPGIKSSPRKPSLETKKELSNLAAEIEIAEQRRHTKEAQAKRLQTQQNEQISRELQMEMAKQRISSAHTTLFWGAVLIVIAIAGIYYVTHSGGMGRGSPGRQVFFALFVIIVSILGRNRGRYGRWGRY